MAKKTGYIHLNVHGSRKLVDSCLFEIDVQGSSNLGLSDKPRQLKTKTTVSFTYNPSITNIKSLKINLIIYNKSFKGKALYGGFIKATVQASFSQTTANDIYLKSTMNMTMNDKNNKYQIRVNCLHDKNGAMEVARYILDEIYTNYDSLEADMIRYHVEETLSKKAMKELDRLDRKVNYNREKMRKHRDPNYIKGLIMWIDQVAPNRPWDHKPLIRKRLSYIAVHRPLSSGVWSETYYHRYKDYDYYLDIWSNIHYGYLGRAVGFSKGELLFGSNMQQKMKDIKDNLDPREWLSFEKKVNDLNSAGDTKDDKTAMNIGIDLYEKYPEPYQLTDSIIMDAIASRPNKDFPASKTKHYCLDF